MILKSYGVVTHASGVRKQAGTGVHFYSDLTENSSEGPRYEPIPSSLQRTNVNLPSQ